jgi:dTMP kinase
MGGMNWDRLKGSFIVLDGPDGSGKSTQLKLLCDVLEGEEIAPLVLRDPGGTAIGEQIRGVLLDTANEGMSSRCEALLYMASRAQLYEERIAPALAGGRCVLCDRWVSSTYAYQAVAGEVGAEAVLALAEVSLERTWPDLTIIIDIDSEVGLSRVGSAPDRMEQKPESFHRLVRDAFLELAGTRDDFRVVDGVGSAEEVHGRVLEVVCDYVNT